MTADVILCEEELEVVIRPKDTKSKAKLILNVVNPNGGESSEYKLSVNPLGEIYRDYVFCFTREILYLERKTEKRHPILRDRDRFTC